MPSGATPAVELESRSTNTASRSAASGGRSSPETTVKSFDRVAGVDAGVDARLGGGRPMVALRQKTGVPVRSLSRRCSAEKSAEN